jgi:hypothetical protein
MKGKAMMMEEEKNQANNKKYTVQIKITNRDKMDY